MPAIISICPLCGLRYDNQPMLELHLREDHPKREKARPAKPRPARPAG